MALIVETGSGTPGANALANAAFVTAYLTERNRHTENGWSTAGATVQDAACIAATDFIETRWGPFFKGSKKLLRIDGREAMGDLLLTGMPADEETLTLGLKTYRLVVLLEQENDVLIGDDEAETVANLVAAIMLAGGAGELYHSLTQANYEAGAYADAEVPEDLVVYARTKGSAGNLIVWETDISNATISGSGFLEDGVDEGEQPLSFPRKDLYTRDGQLVVGVPLKAKQAMAEYSVRSLAAMLAPDPSFAESLVPVIAESVKVGPIEESFQYAAGARPVLTVPYPAADRLLAEYVQLGGGTFR